MLWVLRNNRAGVSEAPAKGAQGGRWLALPRAALMVFIRTFSFADIEMRPVGPGFDCELMNAFQVSRFTFLGNP